MNDSMSIVNLIAHASFVVQLVMLLLVLASLGSWIVIIQRGRFLNATDKALKNFEERFWSGIDLNDLYRECQTQSTTSAAENVFMAGLKEFGKMRQQNTSDPEAVMVGVQRAMRVSVTRESEKLDNHLPLLATIGSTSPYVGLFGTVWGIMHAFHGLANVKQATIATVAPGISEALVATAMGLLAAIPAVIFYNRYVVSCDRISSGLGTFAEEFGTLLFRKAHKMHQSNVSQGREGKS
ncbi:MAG: protein TolQ [Oleibacter sp.]|nr:protein TolQ [Thalassolituus sp.]